jgi:hypothetical protein
MAIQPLKRCIARTLAKSPIKMKIEESTIIKYFDIVLLADKKDSFFGIYRVLSKKYLKDETKEEREFIENIRSKIKEFSEFHGYFEFFPNGHCKLTEKGLDAKEKGGHLKYKKSLTEKPLDWYKITGLIFTFVFGVSTILLGVRNNSLKTDYDSLKSQSELYKDSVAELKGQIELYRLKTSNNTIQTKNLTDLKTD